MKLRFLVLSILFVISAYNAFGQDDSTDTLRGNFGRIPTGKILLLPTGDFFEFKSDGKYYIYFIGATMYKNGDPNDTYDVVNVHFGSDTSVVAYWNEAIKGKNLTTLEIGIESKLITPFNGKDYFKDASIWIDKKCIYKCPEVKSDN